MSESFTREQVDAILAPWIKKAKDMEAKVEELTALLTETEPNLPAKLAERVYAAVKRND